MTSTMLARWAGVKICRKAKLPPAKLLRTGGILDCDPLELYRVECSYDRAAQNEIGTN